MDKEKVINNLDKFYHSKEDVINFFKDYTKMFLVLVTKQRRTKQQEQGLKY